MDSWVFWFLLLQIIVQYPQPAGDGLDEATHLQMELRAKFQEQERIRLERELEQLELMQRGVSWGDLLWSALQPWQVWAFAGLLVLLLAVWFMWRKRSLKAEINNKEEEENETKEEQEEGQEEKQEEVQEEEQEEEEETRAYDLRWLLEERIQWPVRDLETGCNRTMALINNFTSIFRSTLDRTFYPVLEQAIGFGSAFEGWIASRDEGVYRVLLPLTPPAGHTFHLERYIDQQRPGRNFRIRVELECSCPSERPGMNMLCFRHHPDVIRRITQQPSLLELLCTDSYLDVTKTVYWFYVMVRTNWRRLPQSRSWNLELLPSKHFCNLKLTNSQESFQVKVMFGVQRYTSDIFISSRPQGAHTPSTMWPESYGIAETKFMGHMARQVPEDSSHLKCLQLLVGALACDGISIYSIKTIFMHLLNTTPVSQWHTKYFLLQLSDVLGQLRLSLENKYLEHFILGNQRLPEEIRLPPDVQTAYPPNHFYGLRQDPAANSRAMQAYLDLRNRLARVLAYGRC